MTSIWNTKINFILLHSVTLHRSEKLNEKIDWPSIVTDISAHVTSTPLLLKTQFEYLMKNFDSMTNFVEIYSEFKRNYLSSLCQKIEENQENSLNVLYEIVQHIRAKRISLDDIKELLDDGHSKGQSLYLLNILKRLYHYTSNFPSKNIPSVEPVVTSTEFSSVMKQGFQNGELEIVSDTEDEEELSPRNEIDTKLNGSLPWNHKRSASNTTDSDKSPTRRRSQSLTLRAPKTEHQVNIGVEWFAPKFQHQRKSSVSTTEETNENDSTLRQTDAQPTISWLPLTKEQIMEKEHQQIHSKFFDHNQLDQVSSDSDSMEVQCTSSTTAKSETSSRHRTPSGNCHDFQSADSSQQEFNACKRQRLT